MQFRILGPVEALGPDGRAALLRGQPLRLLALLLVRRGETVAADEAIEALWPGALPVHPANALQLVVSRLRHAVGVRTVTWGPGGYALAYDAPEAVDGDRFARLVAEGESELARGSAAAAAERLREALALWRGVALQGARYEAFAAAEVARLDELRLHALELRVGALRAAGRDAEALAAAGAGPGKVLDALGAAASAALAATPREPQRRQVVCVAAQVRARIGGRALDPELLDAVMRRYADTPATALRRHGDPVVETLPDGLLAIFGAGAGHEDDGVRAVRGATALPRAVAALASELAVELELRVGVTAGTALARAPGALPSGEVVAAASRLARDADPGELRLSAEARALLAQRRSATCPDTPLVARDGELAALEAAVSRVRRTGRSELVALIGEPGIGKSRLLAELARRALHGARVLIGHCPAYGDGVTYWPLREIVVQALGGRSPAAVLFRTEEERAAARTVSATLGLGGSAPGEAPAWAFRLLFTVLGRPGPLVIAVDDAHAAEPPLLELVEQLSAPPLPAPVVLLCTGRPELLDHRPGWRAGAVRPAPLDRRASRRLLAARGSLREPAAARIVARAGGNPLFLEQLAAHVGERGQDGSLPPALHALLAARLDLLAVPERQAIEAASVEGQRFHLGAVEALTGDAPARTVERLERRDLVVAAAPLIPGEHAYRFRHALVHDAAYAALPMAARADAHERLAAWLAAAGDDVPDASARIGAQLERAHRACAELEPAGHRASRLAHRAAEKIAAAAAEAHERGDLPSEVAFLERAVALSPVGDAARADLLPPLGVALFEAGSLDRAAEVAAEAATAPAGRVRLRGQVEQERMRAYRHPEAIDPAASLVVARRAAGALAALGDEVGASRARYLMCELEWLRGRSERAVRHAREGLRLARRARAAVELDAGVSVIGLALVVNRTPVREARAECAAMLDIVAGRRFAELGLRGFAAVLDAMDGRFAAAKAQLARSRAGLEDLGLHQASIWMAVFDAHAQLLAGDPHAAEAALGHAEAVAREIGDRWFESTILVDRAHVLLAADRPADAAAAVDHIEDVPSPSDLEWRIKRHAARGKRFAREGDAELGLREAREAIAVAETTELFGFRADAWRDLAEVAALAGADEEATAARATALALYRAKGNRAAARRLQPQRPAGERKLTAT